MLPQQGWLGAGDSSLLQAVEIAELLLRPHLDHLAWIAPAVAVSEAVVTTHIPGNMEMIPTEPADMVARGTGYMHRLAGEYAACYGTSWETNVRHCGPLVQNDALRCSWSKYRSAEAMLGDALNMCK